MHPFFWMWGDSPHSYNGSRATYIVYVQTKRGEHAVEGADSCCGSQCGKG